MRQYEGMFLFDAATVTSEAEAKEEVHRLLDRSEAEIVVCRKWEERRLAYEIKKCKRGLYMLAFFRVAPDKVRGLERDARLSEKVLRLLVLRAEWVTEDRIQEMLPERLQTPAPTPAPTESAGKPTNDGDAKASAPESPDVTAPAPEAVTSPQEGVELNVARTSSESDAAAEPTSTE
ncbi:MAG: 30S ribosomal protein S6 [Planctomycetes bacterium]|nr:30S ribosomal protein S6 [Planctomycetota bacterium]